MSYDSNRIALYLTGKLPPHYKAPIDKLYFIEQVRGAFTASPGGKSNEHFPESVFDFIDRQAKTEEQFFSMVLNKAERIDPKKFEKLIETLEVHPDARGTQEETIIVDKVQKERVGEKLIEENQRLMEKIKDFTRPLLITEGKTDVVILKTAWKTLYNTEIPFDIIENGIERLDNSSSNGCADGLKNQLNYISAISKNRVVVGLFDNDKEGNEQFKGLDKNTFEAYEISKDIRKHKALDVYGFLLPPPKGRENFVHKTDIHQRYIEIEHYFSDEILDKNRMKGDGILGTEIFDIKNSKDAFSKAIDGLASQEFENFKTLFETLKLYLKY